MNVDFIIIGQGIAGTSFAFELLKREKTFVIIDYSQVNTASKLALGVYNPLVLKWFTKAWHIDNQIEYFYNFYKDLGVFLNNFFNQDIGIYKFLKTPYDQNHWLSKCHSGGRDRYMSNELYSLKNKKLINNDFYGLINCSGRVNISLLLDRFRNYCNNNKLLIDEKFNYNHLVINKKSVQYGDIKAKNIIFCEGYGLSRNPYFNKINLKPTKGEYLNIYVKNLNIKSIIHSGLLVIPLGDNYYSVGATYDWENIDFQPTKNAKKKIISVLQKLLVGSYDVIDHKVGIRPSTEDRRPLVGSHSKYHQLYILNGLGTRGVLLAPYLSKCLLNKIYQNIPLHSEISIDRI